MCEWGTDVEVENLLASGGRRRTWKIDACIAPIVKALNEGGVETIQSCCGHGKATGRIDLADGRILRLGEPTVDELIEAIEGRAEFGPCTCGASWERS